MMATWLDVSASLSRRVSLVIPVNTTTSSASHRWIGMLLCVKLPMMNS